MPDPILYLKASISVAVASAMVVLAVRLIMRKSAFLISASTSVLAVSFGLLIGYKILPFSMLWPPANGLNRFLMIVLPATIAVELLTAVLADRHYATALRRHHRNTDRKFSTASGDRTFQGVSSIVLRLLLYACAGRVLLHRSVYLDDANTSNPDLWTLSQTIAAWAGSFVGLIVFRSVLLQLSERLNSCSITLSLGMAILCTGLTTMMAGYINGGVAAFPLTAALWGTALATPLLAGYCDRETTRYPGGTINIGLVGHFGLLCIGHYFGQLSASRAIVLFVTPLLCWVSELPGLRSMSLWQKTATSLIAVTIPLVAVLHGAKRDFDQKLAPLLTSISSRDAEHHDRF